MLKVSGFTVDILWRFCGSLCKLMLRIFEFGFYCLTVLFIAIM